MTNVLEISNLGGGYNRRKIIDKINIQIPKGSITALIGLNGAGKSTTIKHILGLLRPMEGEIKVNGITITSDNEKYRKSISYIPESPVLYEELTLEEHINLTAMAYGLDMNDTWEKADRLLKLFKLSDKKKFFPVHFSKGMKQKVMIICAFVIDPSLFIVDEPFLGLDPVAIADLIELLSIEKSKGKSILMSTHVLDSAERMCDSFVILHKGQVRAKGNLEQLRNEFSMPDASLNEIYLALTEEAAL